MTTSSALPAYRRARLPWAFVPVTLLAISALGVGWMAFVAVQDPHFATESDYYQKALSWDRTQAQAAENQRLGYRIALPSRVRVGDHGQARLELSLVDGSGRLVVGALVQAEAFANAYSGATERLVFSEQAPGVYTAQLVAPRAGLWIFRVRAQAGSDTVTAELRADVAGRGAP